MVPTVTEEQKQMLQNTKLENGMNAWDYVQSWKEADQPWIVAGILSCMKKGYGLTKLDFNRVARNLRRAENMNVNNRSILKGKELMNSWARKACDEIPNKSREELEGDYVTLIKLYDDLWEKNLELERLVRENQGNKGDVPFLLSDLGIKYYQIRDMGRQLVLVQDTSDKEKPAPPQRYDSSNPKAKPVMWGGNWCLDGCIGIIYVGKTGTVFADSDYDFVEVKPSFERVISEDEGYPPDRIKTRRISQHVDILYPFKHPMEELNKLVGCEDIKNRLTEFKSLAEYNKACEQQSPELPVMQIFLHSIFYGNSGTGKSTVCRLYGSLLKEAGMLSKGHVVVADRKVFTGDCFGDTEDILKELIKYSEGGVLMFDEAYLLEGTHPNDPNKMVLPMLLSELADNSKKDFAVVLCGYKDKLDRMLEQNPGLYSRFNNKFVFKDYTLDELSEIGVRYLKTFGHTFTIDGLARFREELASAMAGSNKTSWANARSVKSMIEQIYIKRAMRYGKDRKLDREITAQDICGIPYERSRRIGF